MMKNNDKLNGISQRKKSRSILIGSLIAIFIAITPYIFYTYKSFPSGNTLDLYFFVYESKYQESITTVMWLFMAKFIPLVLLGFWFFTCKHWWYHVILIPIAMYAFQITSLLYEDRYVDEVEIYWLLPIMMIIIPFVYLIRVKLFDKHVLGIDLEEMEIELHNYRKNGPQNSSSEEEKNPSSEVEEENELDYKSQTFSEYLNATFSTNNIEKGIRNFQNNLKGWLNLKF